MSSPASPASFRGRNPPASLKHDHRLPCILVPSFRGRNPPASLKPDTVQRACSGPWGTPGFRGRNPPASLKLLPAGAVAAALPRFPGEKSPGLIEASGASPGIHCDAPSSFRGRNPPASLKHRYPVPGATADGRRVSGGEIPRPH